MSKTLKIENADANTDLEIMESFPTERGGHILVGDAGYFYPARMREGLQRIHNLTMRSTDVFVTSFPRSGTTWTQDMVWLIMNDLDFQKSKSIPLTSRYAFIEFPFYVPPNFVEKLKQNAPDQEQASKLHLELGSISLEDFEALTGPRFIKTHLPLSILPPDALDVAKFVYIARDPRDVAVSYFHLNKLMSKITGFKGDFKTFWNLLKQDKIMWSPMFAIIKEAWNKRHHANMLFLFYEELIEDLPSVVRRICKFLDKPYNEEQLQLLYDHLKFDNFSKNSSVQFNAMEKNGLLQEGEKFVRKGKTGGWREYFDAEMTQQAQRWIADNLRDTDLRFPTHHS